MSGPAATVSSPEVSFDDCPKFSTWISRAAKDEIDKKVMSMVQDARQNSTSAQPLLYRPVQMSYVPRLCPQNLHRKLDAAYEKGFSTSDKSNVDASSAAGIPGFNVLTAQVYAPGIEHVEEDCAVAGQKPAQVMWHSCCGTSKITTSRAVGYQDVATLTFGKGSWQVDTDMLGDYLWTAEPVIGGDELVHVQLVFRTRTEVGSGGM